MERKKLSPDDFLDENIRDLCYAICIQAAVDYKESLALMKRHKTKSGIDSPYTYECFFRSEFFKLMSGIENSDYIIDFLRRTRKERINVFNI